MGYVVWRLVTQTLVLVIRYLFRICCSATLFLELWKRYSAEITHKWDLTGLDAQEEHPRPQYLARLAHIKKKSVNIITNTEEPKVPFWKMRVPATILSFSVVLLLVRFFRTYIEAELNYYHSFARNCFLIVSRVADRYSDGCCIRRRSI